MSIPQKQKIKELFLARPNAWIPLPDILRLGMAQYSPRILELRRAGMTIENRMKTIGGVRHSWFRYTPEDNKILAKNIRSDCNNE